eukprot:12894504-Prorocentrum_lima.AAC.1
MERVLNAESRPNLTISNAAELSFRTLAVGVLWDTYPKLEYHFGYPRPYPPILFHMMIGL